jgi:rare lipoprotein A
MRKSITALFLFSIVALSSQSQITTNQKTSIQQGTIQKVAVLKDTVKKTKVVVLLQEIKRYGSR